MRRCRPLLGTFVEVECDRDGAIGAAFDAVAAVHRLMSAHEADSELSRINRLAHREPVRVSPGTAAVLARAGHFHRLSGGAFDVVRAGARALARGALPRHPGQPIPAAEDFGAVHLDGDRVRLERPACLDLGGIAKGYAVDRAVAAIRARGATRGLVNAGGDLFGFGAEAWTITVVDPRRGDAVAQVAIRDEALATSALVDGSGDHLPGVGRWTSVTVRAPTACDADALTKIVWAGAGATLAAAGASAFGIRPDGTVEPIGAAMLAA